MQHHLRRGLAALIGTAGLVTAGFAGSAPAATTASGAVVRPAVTGQPDHYLGAHLSTPPTTAYCRNQIGISCYSPVQLQNAYGTPSLYQRGTTGRGRTIAIIDPFGSPTIANDLHVFDANYGLADPPSLQVISPVGSPPPFNSSDPVQLDWATETTLDVEYAHAMAPGANILLVTTPVAETEGVTGFPEIIAAENYVIDHGLADVISQSFGATENTFPSKAALFGLRSAFTNAAAHHVTVLASSGDAGATDSELDGDSNYPYRVNSWPSSDPLVTSIGGTQLFLDANGSRTSPDVVWNDGYGAGGGGVSEYFSRPAFQNRVRSVVGGSRGTPDISMSAAVDGGAIFYYSFNPAVVGWHIVGGTSEAAPLFAGIVALAAQRAGRRLGDINQALYILLRLRGGGVVDVTSGDNSFGGVTGYQATQGYDLASGIGTLDAAKFVPALAILAPLTG